MDPNHCQIFSYYINGMADISVGSLGFGPKGGIEKTSDLRSPCEILEASSEIPVAIGFRGSLRWDMLR